MTPMKRLILAALAATSLAAALSACAPVIIGGAAMTALVVTDRRTSGTQLEDEGIELRAGSRIRDTLGSRVHVNVNSYNRQVLLTGEAPDAATRQTVEDTVSRVENVRSVVNDIAIAAQSTLSQRSSDTLITGKVRASLVDARDLSANAFRVVTERGTVYLMGRVTSREADRATQIARNVSGVTRVVRIFEVISEEDLARMSNSRAAQPATRPAQPEKSPQTGY
ncbi:MAG: BON domain-containing protein [Pseudomonadota bacterium]